MFVLGGLAFCQIDIFLRSDPQFLSNSCGGIFRTRQTSPVNLGANTGDFLLFFVSFFAHPVLLARLHLAFYHGKGVRPHIPYPPQIRHVEKAKQGVHPE